MNDPDAFEYEDTSTADQLAELGVKFQRIASAKGKSIGKDSLVKLLKVQPCLQNLISDSMPRCFVCYYDALQALTRCAESAAVVLCIASPSSAGVCSSNERQRMSELSRNREQLDTEAPDRSQ